MNRFDLYELAVQSPRLEVMFLRAVHGGSPTRLCEDFSGPGSLARAWVREGPGHTAVCIDNDEEPLAHARRRARERLTDAECARITFRCTDVREAADDIDVIAALNFGVCELHERPALLAWLHSAHRRLHARAGVLVADLYGGPGSLVAGETAVHIEDPDDGTTVTYTWEQTHIDLLTGRAHNRIHFDLPDGRTLRDAFVYDWRLWTVPELRDAMIDAGFRATEVYTRYGDAIDGDGNLHIRPAAGEEVCDEDDWGAYIVGRT